MLQLKISSLQFKDFEFAVDSDHNKIIDWIPGEQAVNTEQNVWVNRQTDRQTDRQGYGQVGPWESC